MRPPAELLDRLTACRLLAGEAGLSVRPGERRSGVRGPGMEFAGSRPYREGDDIRHLDNRLFARLRKPYLREYLADRQLRVAILVDTTASMAFGTPQKRDFASMLAGLLGYAAMSSGDLVEVGLGQGEAINWSDALQGSSRSEVLFRWLDGERPPGSLPFSRQLRAALPRLQRANLSILISDWWLDDPERELRLLGDLPGPAVVVQVTAPEEENPLLLGRGPVRMRDAETGATLDLMLDARGAADYGRLLAQHREGLRAATRRLGGRFLAVRSDTKPADLFARLVQGHLLGQHGATRGNEAQGPATAPV